MLLYLARHAQTESSKVDGYNGRRELPLTAEGREQARALGQRLAGVPFAAVYRSPLGRTLETASLVSPVAPQIVPELIEMSFGDWEGLSADELKARDGQRYAAWQADPVNVAPPGGETITEVAARAMLAISMIAQRNQSPALVVSHKATLRALGAALLGMPLGEYRNRLAMDECALSLVEWREGRPPFVRLWNDTAHLGPDPAATTKAGR